ncbi:MAG: hypothetical protein R3293_28415 [Candidatus Promineifilaceae bacterium]|nr:hypothetical protein [Candidatus Promineifilaceae bacterium]
MGKRVGILFAGVFSLLAFAGMAGMDRRLGTLRSENTPLTIILFLVAFVAYIAALYLVERQGIPGWWLWLVAIVARLLMLLTTPTLSDDVYRMLWDGHVANAGVSPYALPIDSPALDHLEVPVRAMANNTWMASPYLPAAQVVYYGITAVFPLHPIALQAVMVAFDLLTAWVIAKLLAIAFLPGRRLVIYLWNPLVIVEVAHGAHVDAWMVLLTLLAVYWAFKFKRGTPLPAKRSHIVERVLRLLSPLALALGTLTKPLPLLLLPVFFWLWKWPQRLFYGLTIIAILLPFGLSAGWGLQGELDGTGLFGAMRIYAEQWNFNSGIFHWLEIGLGRLGINEPVDAAKVVIFVLMLFLMTLVWFAARGRSHPRSALRLMAVPLMGYVLLTPTFHPWYLLILIAFLPFLAPAELESKWRWLWVAPWLYLSGALIFSYLTYLNPLRFGEIEWVRQLEWPPTIALFVLAVIVWRVRSGHAQSCDVV